MAKTKLTTASVLAFERKLSNSDAQMFSGDWDAVDNAAGWSPIVVNEKDVRGTISNRQKNAIQSDPAKLDAEVQKPNLQRVDVAALPFEHNTLKVAFSLRVLGDLITPSACNDQEYQAALQSTINGYIEQSKFTELSMRYAENLANGRFLWRNRVGAEGVTVVVKQIVAQQEANKWTFDSYDFNLRKFGAGKGDLTALANVIQNGLSGDDFAFLKVEAFVRLGEGQEVFPSQELILDSSGKDKKSKTLYQVANVAAMHSQKIGNALRTVDDWYPDSAEFGPISVEPFGSVTNRGKAFRQPKQKMDFYTLLDNWVLKGEEPPTEQQHYVIANLIRGGVFGGKGE
jgi:CRISPR-associated protein Csy3